MFPLHSNCLTGKASPDYNPPMKLKTWIKAEGISDAEFARRLGVNPTQVSRWLAGKVRPDWDYLKKIILITRGQVSADDFIEVESDPDPLARLAARVVA